MDYIDQENQKHSTLKKTKRGRRPTSSTPSPPSKRREVEEVRTGLSSFHQIIQYHQPRDISLVLQVENERLLYGSHQLRLFLLRTHASRRNIKNLPVASTFNGPVTIEQLLATGPIAQLPSRTGFFPFSSLSSTLFDEPVGNQDDDERSWPRRLYYRLLNTPDLGDSSTRLTAPLLSLPCPLRHPEFYRFICASGLLANFEAALNCSSSLQPQILATVSPDVVRQSETKNAPFYPTGKEWPPLSLRGIIPFLEDIPTMEEGFQQLDLLLEYLFRTWEAYAGRKNWAGKHFQQIRSLYNQIRVS